MKALVLGAAGHVGNAIVRHLLDQRWQVTAVVRRHTPNLHGLEVSEVHGDLDTPGLLESWIAGHDLVVDAAAPYPLALSWRTDDALHHATNRTARLLAAVRRSGAQLAYVSVFVTLPQYRDGSITRAWPTRLARRLHPYFACKQIIETELLRAARRGLPIIVVNPTSFLGPWDLKPRQLCLVPQLLNGRFHTAPDHVVNVIDVRDVAAGILRALEAKRWGEPILLSGHSLPINALNRWICELAGTRPPQRYVPASVAVAPACLAEGLSTLLGRPPSGTALAVLLTCHFDWVPISPAQHELGLVPRPLSATLSDTVSWYRRIGYC